MSIRLSLTVSLLFALACCQTGAQTATAAAQERARQAKTVPEALSALGVGTTEPGKRVLLEVPDIAVAKRPITVTVTSRIPGTDWIAILSTRSPTPLLALEEFTPGVDHQLKATLKLEQTGRIRAIVRSSGKFYEVSREIKIATPEAR